MSLAYSNRTISVWRYIEARFRMTGRRGILAAIVCSVIAVAGGSGVWAALRGGLTDRTEASPPLAAMVPQGALLTIEAKDFSGLLKRWNDSPERTAWLKSDSYSVFSNSRLFGRLGGAQDEFAQAAGVAPDEGFLKQVAGRESIFAWYDIGKLEFLYITRMSASTAEKSSLLQLRTKFEARKIGAQTFYVRMHGNPEKGEEQRTVAFATSNGWLLLATREDLIAGALTLISDGSANQSIAAEPWFADARGAAATNAGDLRMTLNLEKIVPTPYFRSYWVQQNITQMKQYRSALADLYLDGDTFREERVLLPKSTSESDKISPDLAVLTALLPPRAGVYRAQALPSVEGSLDAFNTKLLQRTANSIVDRRYAPAPDLSVGDVGTSSDLETRIDAPPMERRAKGTEFVLLRQLLSGAELQGVMTVSRTADAADEMWVPFQNAVVLSSTKDWDAEELQAALKQALSKHLTSGGLGLEWKPVGAGGSGYFEISDVRPLVLAVRGKLCIVADDAGLMHEMLGAVSKSAPDAAAQQATMIAGVDLLHERGAYARWTKLVDSSPSAQRSSAGTDAPTSDGTPHEPAFFSENLRGLSDVFAPLEGEKMIERRDGGRTRQVVTYSWRH